MVDKFLKPRPPLYEATRKLPPECPHCGHTRFEIVYSEAHKARCTKCKGTVMIFENTRDSGSTVVGRKDGK